MSKIRYLGLAVGLVCAHGAQASLDDGHYEGGAGLSGELFLSVWDPVGQISYYKDLGLRVKDLATNPSQTLSFDLSDDPAYAPFINNPNPLVFNVAASSNTFDDPAGLGNLYTSNDPGAAFLVDINVFGSVQQNIQSYLLELNDHDPNIDLSDLDADLSDNRTPGKNGYHGNTTWGPNMGGIVGFSTHIDVGTENGLFYFNTLDPGTNFEQTKTILLPNVWHLTSNPVLTYAPVPVPAAVWLLGSGLLGLVSVARRRQSA